MRNHLKETTRPRVFKPKGLRFREPDELALMGIVSDWKDYLHIITTQITTGNKKITEKVTSKAPGRSKAATKVAAPKVTASVPPVVVRPPPTPVTIIAEEPIVVPSSLPLVSALPEPSFSMPSSIPIVVAPRPNRKRRSPSTPREDSIYGSSHPMERKHIPETLQGTSEHS